MNIPVATWKEYREKRKLEQKMVDLRFDIEWRSLMDEELELIKALPGFRPIFVPNIPPVLPVTVEDCLDWLADGKPVAVKKLQIKFL